MQVKNMKKIALLLVIITILSTLSGCNGNGSDEVINFSDSTSAQVEQTISPDDEDDNRRFGATSISPFSFDSEDRIQLLNNVVTDNRVYVLLSIREQAKIQERLDEITPNMPIEQVSQIHDEVERLYVREELFILDYDGNIKNSMKRESFFDGHQIPVQSIHAGENEIYVVSKSFRNDSVQANGNFVQKMSYDGQVDADVMFLDPSLVRYRTNPNYHSFVWDKSGICYAAGEYYEGERREQFIDFVAEDGTIINSITEDLESENYSGMLYIPLNECELFGKIVHAIR